MERICPGHSAVDRRSFCLQTSKDRHLNGVSAAQKHYYRELQQLRSRVVTTGLSTKPGPFRGWRSALDSARHSRQVPFLALDCPGGDSRLKGALRASLRVGVSPTLDPAAAHRALAAIRKMAPDQDLDQGDRAVNGGRI